MQLYLMRHGQAAAPSATQEQVLTRDGQSGIEKIARQLNQQGIKVSQLFHSEKIRSRQTAEIMARHIAATTTLQIHAHIKPNDDPQQIINDIQDWHDDTLIVSHLPFIPHLIGLLTADIKASNTMSFAPGTVISLSPKNTAWQIEWILSP